jgi:cohesin complex subunit SA-1/2
MVENALRFMTTHVIWKAQHLSTQSVPGSQDGSYRETLLEQRGMLIDKVTEFALGTRSNTSEDVKREVYYPYLHIPLILIITQAFQTLMTLHVLFAPGQPIVENEDEMEESGLALHLSDETQSRCTGFIQAEIERFAERLETLISDDGVDHDGTDSGSSTEGDAPKPKRGKKKAKAAANDVASTSSEFYEMSHIIRILTYP